MTTSTHSVAPTLIASALGGVTTALLRRMENEYSNNDTLSNPTVAAMYSTYAAHTAAMAWGTAFRIWPVPLPLRSARLLGTVLATAGAGVAVVGVRPFGLGAQLSGVRPGSLHASGIYRYSRNPQYLGLGLVATGAAIAARSAFVGLGASGVWLAFGRWIPNEERHLVRIFGNQYVDYQAKVRRWFGTRPANRSSSFRA